MTRDYAYKQIAASQVRQIVYHGIQSPTNERQARPLTKLDTPEQQREAWQKAVETAPEGRVTAHHVEKVVREMEGTKEVKKKKVPRRANVKTPREEELISEEFRDAIKLFIGVLQNARVDNWKSTSKKAIVKFLESMLFLIRDGGEND